MAALPETNISVTLVKNALGSSLSVVGGLRQSSLNNWWGFNSIGRGWGNTSPIAPFKLGDYRGYDHLFRCWSYNIMEQTPTDYNDLMETDLNLKSFPAWSEADTASHVFDILWKRTSDFHQGGYTTLETNVTLQNQYLYGPITFSHGVPPDGGAALDEGDTVYIAIVRKSSPALKWDDNQSAMTIQPNQIGGNDYIIIPMTVPTDPYTYVVSFFDMDIDMYIENLSSKGIVGSVHLKSDTRENLTVNSEIEFAINDNTFANPEQTLSLSTTVASNPNGGTPADRFITVNADPNNQFSVGDLVYYRFRITGIIGNAIFSTNWSPTRSLTVTDTPPL